MRHVEGALHAAAVGVGTLSIEDLLEDSNVVRVDGTIEGDGDHLGHLRWLQTSGNPGTIRRAEAVRQLTLAEITIGGPVGILVNGASVLV